MTDYTVFCVYPNHPQAALYHSTLQYVMSDSSLIDRTFLFPVSVLFPNHFGCIICAIRNKTFSTTFPTSFIMFTEVLILNMCLQAAPALILSVLLSSFWPLFRLYARAG